MNAEYIVDQSYFLHQLWKKNIILKCGINVLVIDFQKLLYIVKK